MFSEPTVLKLTAGNYRIPVQITPVADKRLELMFKYNKALMAEIKTMAGARWHGFDEENPKKVWSVLYNSRNVFQILFLAGENPYAPYDAELVYPTFERPLYHHQQTMVAHGLTRHYCVFAGEMGTGKTLAAIEIMERIEGLRDELAWYVGPRSGVTAVKRELVKWDSLIHPLMYTYEALVKRVKNLLVEDAPRAVFFDECSKVKTPTAQRSKAAYELAEAVRERWGRDGYCILMSGTPAPKVPTDWWHQCEVARPGFIREGNIHIFKRRLCLLEERQSPAGGVYPHVVTWLDDENKCATCGQPESEHDWQSEHRFTKSQNEVSYLYKRMKGLVLVTLKKDCLDLPEKQYEIIQITPAADTLRAAQLIKKTSRRAIQALTLLRELSDGFQYREIDSGEKIECPSCKGAKVQKMQVPKETVDIMAPQDFTEADFTEIDVICDYCGGDGEVTKFERDTAYVKCPKDDYFIDDLDAHNEVGRYVVWGGFTGTIDRLVKIALDQAWTVLRVDGRGFHTFTPDHTTASVDTLLDAMDGSHPKKQELLQKYPKVCFVGHPQAGGMALTLHASPTALYYSNSFSGEARMQSEDRIHRLGMDMNRGATIKDLIHLPSDRLVLDNLKQKKKLQSLTLGDVEDAFANTTERVL